MKYDIKQGDCLELMKDIPDDSIDMILCDLPYGTTACKWDIIIPLDRLWVEYERIIKDNGAIVLFGRQPFTSTLVMSNTKMWRYELVWEKEKGTDFGNANRKFVNSHENIEVFYKKQPTYNKQLRKGKPYIRKNNRNNSKEDLNFTRDNSGTWVNEGNRTPTTVLKIARDITSLHPTQKPIALLEYLIKTYTNEGETVLDNCMGSGSTGVACIHTNRNFIGMELEEKYFNIAKDRMESEFNNIPYVKNDIHTNTKNEKVILF